MDRHTSQLYLSWQCIFLLDRFNNLNNTEEPESQHYLYNLISGCLVVIVCSLIVYFTDQNVGKFVDPALSIFSAVLLLILSYPYSKYIPLVQNTVILAFFQLKQFHEPCGFLFPPASNVAVPNEAYLLNNSMYIIFIFFFSERVGFHFTANNP